MTSKDDVIQQTIINVPAKPVIAVCFKGEHNTIVWRGSSDDLKAAVIYREPPKGEIHVVRARPPVRMSSTVVLNMDDRHVVLKFYATPFFWNGTAVDLLSRLNPALRDSDVTQE